MKTIQVHRPQISISSLSPDAPKRQNLNTPKLPTQSGLLGVEARPRLTISNWAKVSQKQSSSQELRRASTLCSPQTTNATYLMPYNLEVDPYSDNFQKPDSYPKISTNSHESIQLPQKSGNQSQREFKSVFTLNSK